MRKNSIEEQLHALMEDIPHGRVVSYGDLARSLGIVPVQVGRLLARVPEGLPWHRVVGADGALRIARRAPEHAALQRALLAAEGILLDDHGRVPAEFFDETNTSRLVHA